MAESKFHTWQITDEQEEQRLDHFLTEALPNLSRSRIQQLIRTHLATIDNQAVKTGTKLKSGMQVTVEIPPPKILSTKPQQIDLDIIFEDKDILILNKPVGMVVHPAPGSYEDTLVNALLAHCKDLQGIGDALRPGIVHRLDKNTSGIMVVAKNEIALKSLTEQLAIREMGREYLAICLGILTPNEGTIDLPINRSKRNRKKMAIDPEQGKPAITHYKTLYYQYGLSVIDCKLETGRTHQIRVHLSHKNTPVLCDPEYGPKKKTTLSAIPPDQIELRKLVSDTNHQLLHARKLRLIHPTKKEELTFEAEAPIHFKKIIEVISK